MQQFKFSNETSLGILPNVLVTIMRMLRSQRSQTLSILSLDQMHWE